MIADWQRRWRITNIEQGMSKGDFYHPLRWRRQPRKQPSGAGAGEDLENSAVCSAALSSENSERVVENSG